ncbi:DUF3397 domain-containing protein [Vagococcus entomophilus]|uniref:DUF3397 domain-containing protein n=1 Tax=Vagococcus entomophilus TaxID=1160095 RepID=A0A430AIK6_9ENTE|nr:DUF3397 domain-containing protein [Vagococcus entomophilus]RSU07824.1 hypothetical protein CBF30_00870 [Vagococcus entomophilus]
MGALSLQVVFWYIFPILLLFASSYIVTTFSLDTRFKVKAVDIATPFLLVGIHELSKVAFKHSVLPYILLTILLLGIIIAIVHAYYYHELNYRRYFKMYARFVFLLTFILYVVLIGLSFFAFI